MQVLEAFDIRNFTDRLEPAKGKDRYICPACDGHNLTIDPKDGAYQCWTGGCTPSEIREAIRPLKAALAEATGGDHGYRPSIQKTAPFKHSSPPDSRPPTCMVVGSGNRSTSTAPICGWFDTRRTIQPSLRAVRKPFASGIRARAVG